MNDPLTHFDPEGAAHMVKITAKQESPRLAVARANVRMATETLARIEAGSVGKGDVLGVARLAGIGGAKLTATMIPLCHPVRITGVELSFEIDRELPGVVVTAQVQAHDRTGPDMEAMVAVTTAALTIYDMCKAMDRGMTIEQVMLIEKSGGKSGHWSRSSQP